MAVRPYHFPNCAGAGCNCAELAQQELDELESGDHDMPMIEWAIRLWRLHLNEYREPKAVPRPELRALRREARVDIYTERESAGKRLYHERDIWRRQPGNDSIQIGPVAENEPNGAPVVEQRLMAREYA